MDLLELVGKLTTEQPYDFDSDGRAIECRHCDESRHDYSPQRWFGHKPDCPWMESMALLGRPLGVHRVYDPREDCLRCYIYDSTLEEHHAHEEHRRANHHLDTRWVGRHDFDLWSPLVPYAPREDPFKRMARMMAINALEALGVET